MYKLTPMQAIKGILALTNPVKVSLSFLPYNLLNCLQLLSGILSLFLARPASMQSLLQKMIAASTELKRSEKLLKEAKQEALALLKRYDRSEWEFMYL